ncbi:DDE superfamily endonuclease-domain-containing protein [Lentinula aciculospora]|uniref:DDE superfamily endonuclease-domain-containing protein n=1 Tax=Lentinula aciculospora TaxID=153920 RepID=A0A9W8ZTW4_9AGAR|nr:DDE superfamily endonuclease-domain-containing protein [Lentinula aciculospora]
MTIFDPASCRGLGNPLPFTTGLATKDMTKPKHLRSATHRLQKVNDEVEARIQQAKESLLASTDPKYNPRKASIRFDVPYDTLRKRLKGIQPRKKAHKKEMLLNEAEQSVLGDWMRFLSLAGLPIYKRMEVAEESVSNTWIGKFLKKHRDLIKSACRSGLDPKRAQAFNFTTVHGYFEELDKVLKKEGVPWELVYNVDEKGDQKMYRVHSDKLELVTIVDCVCADGTAPIKPCFVFPGKKMCNEWAAVDEEILLATSENGWTDNEIGFQWFKQNFIPQATARKEASGLSDKPIVLLFDGHQSHISKEWVDLALENNIVLLCLPSHTTHRLQPLDVGCFGPLQTAWFNRCDEILEETGEPMPLYMLSDDALFDAEALIMLEEGDKDSNSDSDSEFVSDSDSDDAPQPVAFTQLELRRTHSQTSQLSVTSSPSLSSSTASSAWSEELAQLRLEIAKLRQENAGLKLESASVKAQHDAAQAHAVNKKESLKRVSTSARVLTSREVRKEIEQDAAKKVQRQKIEAERETRKAEAEKADIIQRAEQERLGTQFSGSLNSMSKKALVDIAFSFKVPSKDVTQDALRFRLHAHEELKKHPHYVGLFERTRKHKDPPSDSNPGASSHCPPPPSQRFLSPELSLFSPGPSSFAPGPSLFAPGPSSLAPGLSSLAPGPSSYPLSMHHSSFSPPPFFGRFQLSSPPLRAQNYNPCVFENQSPSTLHQSITPIYTVPPPLPHGSSSQSPITSSSSVLQPHPRPRPRPRPVPHHNVDNPE